MKTIKLPTEGKNVIRLKNDCDLTACAVRLAHREVVKKTNKVLWVRNIVVSNTMKNWYKRKNEYQEFLDSLKCFLPYDMNPESDRGQIMECECNDQDTWWLLFEDNNENLAVEIFYSPGA